MLDQLIESRSNSRENTRRSEFMIATFVIAVVVVLGLWTRDLFAHDYGMGGDDLALTTLVAPVPIPEEEPPPEKPPEKQKQPDVDVRKELIQNIMQSPVKPPEQVSTQRNAVKEMRLDRLTKLGDVNTDTGARVDPGASRVVDTGGTAGLNTGAGTDTTGGAEAPPPPPTVKPKPPPPKTISGGVLNGKAISLPKPAYPPAARAVRASGSVSVQVLIDENGHVVSASAVSGHQLLQQAAVSAARGARFSPTLLSGQPVKVSGVITYNFVP
jgi:periplasmic protein TonB